MADSYDPASGEPKDLLRLKISDVGGTSGSDFIFHDEEIEAFLSMGGGSLNRGAAEALRTLAGNEALVMKHITFLELKTEGATVSKELRELAKMYDELANDDGDPDDGVVIIEMITEPFGRRSAYFKRFGLDLDT